MSALADYVDRLSAVASSIRSSASAVGHPSENRPRASTSSAGPFTRAVLDTSLGDLIRDIDPSELGLFTLVQPPTHTTQVPQEDVHAQKAEIARVALPIATPLRRPPAASQHRREDGQRHGEYDPEVYANAALKLLDRYQSVRQMPRYSDEAESLVERLAAVRQNITTLNDQMKQVSSSSSNGPQMSPKSKALQEERRIEDVEARIVELRKRKEALLHKQKRMPHKQSAKSSARTPAQSPPPPDPQEESFWNTPGAGARTLHFTDDLLTDEQMDMGDMSALSSPIPEQVPSRSSARQPRAGPSRGKAMQFTQRSHIKDDSPEVRQTKKAVTSQSTTVDDEEDDDNDKTVVLDKFLEAPSRTPPVHASDKPHSPADEPSPSSPTSGKPAQDQDMAHTSAGTAEKKTKFRVTADVERIVAKIWATVGDVVMPGHSFDLSASGSGAKPPRAKETIVHLRSVAALTPSPTSPSTSSISYTTLSTLQPPSNGPTPQQILTAQMLLALLSSPPSYSMPLNKLKEVLGATGAQGSAVTRPIYGCVAKRLLKIDRGGGEQVVRFDT